MDYEDKLILAPMVRVGTLPFRLMSQECGADITYSEELVALKLMKATRVVNEKRGTIDFVAPDKSIVYQTSRFDKNNIAQLGVANAATALAAASVIVNDVAGIDLNCGCPKHFSTQGGMGAALLKTPEVIHDILSTLHNNLDKPVTCKIRILEKDSDTVEIIRRAEHAGVSAIGIHARFTHERPRERAHWDRLASVIELAGAAVGIPIIANGDIHTPEDIVEVKNMKGVSSVMIARGAINDPSIFSKGKDLLYNEEDPEAKQDTEKEQKEGMGSSGEGETKHKYGRQFFSRSDVAKRYTEIVQTTLDNLPNTKYVLKTILEVPGGFKGAHLPQDQALWGRVNSCKSMKDICALWNINDSAPPLPCNSEEDHSD